MLDGVKGAKSFNFISLEMTEKLHTDLHISEHISHGITHYTEKIFTRDYTIREFLSGIKHFTKYFCSWAIVI